MVIRRATYEDIDELMKVFEGAKQIMRSCGNLHQWKEGYPSVDILHKDIESEHCFIACEDNKILATMALIPGPDPTYAYIEGRWPDDDPYYVIHRIATSARDKTWQRRCSIGHLMKYVKKELVSSELIPTETIAS